MSFKIGNTTFGFTMKVPDGDEKPVDEFAVGSCKFDVLNTLFRTS